MQRRGFRVLQLGDSGRGLREAIEGDTGVQVVNVMVTDVCGKPTHQRPHLHEAGGFEGRFFIGPTRIIAESDTWEIVLRVEKITSDRAGDKVGNNHCQK